MSRSALGPHWVSVLWKGGEAGASIRHLLGSLVGKPFRGIHASVSTRPGLRRDS